MNIHERQCLEAYKSFERKKNLLSGVVYETPMPPDPKEIDNWGLPIEERKFKHFDYDEMKVLDPDNNEDDLELCTKIIQRFRDGYWFYNKNKLEYVTGQHYMFLTHWRIDITKPDGSASMGFPYWVDAHAHFMYHWDFCVNAKNCLGAYLITSRRWAKTSLGTSIGYFDTSLNNDRMFAIQSKNEPDAKKVFAMIIKSWQSLPSWIKPTDSGYTGKTKKLDFVAPTKKVGSDTKRVNKNVRNSHIFAESAKENALDGMRLSYGYFDEEGKTEKTVDIAERWNIAKECFRRGSVVIGKSLHTTTVEDSEKYGVEGVKRIWDGSDYLEATPSGVTKSGLYRMFVPADFGYFGKHPETGEPFVDEWGYSNRALARAYIMQERSKLDGDDLLSFRRKYPLDESDAFLAAASASPFDTQRIDDQHAYNVASNVYDERRDGELMRVNFYWKDPVKKDAVFYRVEDGGRWLMWIKGRPKDEVINQYEKLREGGRRPKFNDLYFTGVDPTNELKPIKGGSDNCAITIGMPSVYTGLDKKTPVCLYLYRHTYPEDFEEDMLMQAVYFSSPMLIELNKSGVDKHFRKHGCEGYLMFDPFELDQKKKFRKKRGWHNSKDSDRQDLIRGLKSYTVENIGKNEDGVISDFPFKDILEDMRRFNPEKWTPHDITVAMMLAVAASNHGMTRGAVNEYDVGQLFPIYRNGRRVY